MKTIFPFSCPAFRFRDGQTPGIGDHGLILAPVRTQDHVSPVPGAGP